MQRNPMKFVNLKGRLQSLFAACKSFIETINQNPLEIINRVWQRFELDPEAEKLGISK